MPHPDDDTRLFDAPVVLPARVFSRMAEGIDVVLARLLRDDAAARPARAREVAAELEAAVAKAPRYSCFK